MKKVIIIGAGITGSFIAHKLCHYALDITVIEAEADVANGTTMANSAIVHTGYDPEDGTLKALLNVRGAQMYPEICKDLGCDYVPCGAYVVARSNEEGELAKLYERAEKRHIKVAYLTSEEARKEEPNLHESIVKVMSVPETAIIYPWEVSIALMEEAVLNGVTLKLGQRVEAIVKKDRTFIVETNKESYDGDYVINAAGCKAEEIASLIEEAPFHIQPKKGEYFVLSKQARGFVNHIIYPTPTHEGKGVLCVPTTHGNILLGPTSEECNQNDISTSQQGLDLIKERLANMMNNIPYQEIIRSYTGIRACGNDNDFYINASVHHEHMIHIACIDSPGLASSPAIAEYVYEQFFQQEHFEKKSVFKKRKHPIIKSCLSMDEKQRMIQKNSAYGQIVCRCEQISRGEIIDAIHRPFGAKTMKAIKKRVRPGMGQCQGGFCEPHVAKILAEELHISLSEVLYDSEDSKLGEISKGGPYEN